MKSNLFRVISRFKREEKKSAAISSLASTVEKVDFRREFRLKRRLFRPTRRQTLIGVFVFYLVAIPVYFYFGLQPSSRNAAAAEEAKTATSSLSIPSLGLETPLADVALDGRKLTAPSYIAGRYSPSKNKTLIMGHSSTIFQTLHQISLGAEIFYENQTYTVVNTTTLEKAAISMNEVLKPETTPTLILMTCAGSPLENQDYTHRLIVTASI